MNNIIFQCKKIYKKFIRNGQSVTVLNDISLQACSGEITLISGRSGTGKSVLLWILSGIDNADGGFLFINGKKIDRTTKFKRGRIFQNFNLVPTWTVKENIEASLSSTTKKCKEYKNKVEKILLHLQLQDKINYFPHEISIGQQQKVAIARTLISEPDIIFADEPTGSVDPETGNEIINLLKHYSTRKNKPL